MKLVSAKIDYCISSKFRTLDEYKDFRNTHACTGQRVRVFIGLNRIDRLSRFHLMIHFPNNIK